MNLAAQGHEIAHPAPHPSLREGAFQNPNSFFILLSHAFALILLGWPTHTFLVHREGSMLIPIVLVPSMIATRASMIRSLLPRE